LAANYAASQYLHAAGSQVPANMQGRNRKTGKKKLGQVRAENLKFGKQESGKQGFWK
jgi:hypothetical protein